jgi:transcriptional regulator with XRE-family HTH domain
MPMSTVESTISWKKRNPFRRWRLSNRMTLKEASDSIGCSVSQLSEWERGGHTPRLSTLEKIAPNMLKDPFALYQTYITWLRGRP